jgi:hypothetical protein
VIFFFESQNETVRKGKKTDESACNRKIKYRGARPLLLRRGLPSSTFLAHLYDALKGIKNTRHHHQNGNQRIAGTVEALLPRRASGTV